uniref:Uncharacterized protein n=1 Tax=Schistocephalus solidus TaxID=70667 RepID=A0A0X3PPJ1_SCHSO
MFSPIYPVCSILIAEWNLCIRSCYQTRLTAPLILLTFLIAAERASQRFNTNVFGLVLIEQRSREFLAFSFIVNCVLKCSLNPPVTSRPLSLTCYQTSISTILITCVQLSLSTVVEVLSHQWGSTIAIRAMHLPFIHTQLHRTRTILQVLLKVDELPTLEFSEDTHVNIK